MKAGTTVATVTSTALTIYNNYDKIKSIILHFDIPPLHSDRPQQEYATQVLLSAGSDGANLVMLDTFKLWGEQIFGWYYFEEREVWEPNPNGPASLNAP